MSERQPNKPTKDPESLEKQPSQAELFKLIEDKLTRLLTHNNINPKNDGKYTRFLREPDGYQVGIIYQMPREGGGKTVSFDTNLDLDLDLEKIIKTFESSIPARTIFYKIRSPDSVKFTFFPGLTEQEVEILEREIEPLNGHIVVIQGEYVVMSKQDETKPISTFGIGPCRGIIIYDPQKGIVAVAHLDAEYADISLIQQMREDLIKKGANPEDLKFFGTPNID